MQYGYIEDAIGERDYCLGTLSPKVLRPTGQWLLDLPKDEVQMQSGFDSMNCTVYGTLNALEILRHAQFRERDNYSERYGGVMAGTTPEGNSPHKVIEVIRKYAGVVQESALPFTDKINTWDRYYAGVTFALKLQGLSYIKTWDIRHEWVLDGERNDWQNVLVENLRYSPLGIAVNAWNRKQDLFIRAGSDTHWCVLVGYAPQKHWIVFDSYEKNLKKLSWDFGFTRAKRYSIERRASLDGAFVVRAAQGLLGIY